MSLFVKITNLERYLPPELKAFLDKYPEATEDTWLKFPYCINSEIEPTRMSGYGSYFGEFIDNYYQGESFTCGCGRVVVIRKDSAIPWHRPGKKYIKGNILPRKP